MKARIKGTGEIIDVYWSSYNVSTDISSYKEKGCNGRGKEWSEKELSFTDTIDWEQRRYEIAKETFSSSAYLFLDQMTPKESAKIAIEYADALINELKNKTE